MLDSKRLKDMDRALLARGYRTETDEETFTFFLKKTGKQVSPKFHHMSEYHLWLEKSFNRLLNPEEHSRGRKG